LKRQSLAFCRCPLVFRLFTVAMWVDSDITIGDWRGHDLVAAR